MPPFEISASQLILALVRGAFVACVLSTFGVALFLSATPSPVWRRSGNDMARQLLRQCWRLFWGSLAAACLTGIAWLVLQTRDITDAATAMRALAAVPAVLFGTSFGQVLLLQALALVAAGLVAVRRNGALAAAWLTGGAVLAESGHSHAFAMSSSFSALLLSQALHLLAASAWLGGLLPLFVVVRGAPLDIAALAARRFSVLGVTAVLTLTATALFQGWLLSGGLHGITGTAYGTVLMIKTGLFMALVALAACNRLYPTPGLRTPWGELSRRALLRNIALETLLGLGIVLAAGLLSGLEPGMHHG